MSPGWRLIFGNMLKGFAGPLTVEQQFKGGQSNLTFKLITPKTVMRSKPGSPAAKLPPAHAIDREFRVMRRLAGSEVPVAQMHACVRTNRLSAARFT